MPENESRVETPRSPCSMCQYRGQALPSLSIRFQPISNSSPVLGVAQLENKHMCVQMLGPGDLSSNTKHLYISTRESPQHTKVKRACACWSKIKPQNGGLKLFFKAEFKSETSKHKRVKCRVILEEAGMRKRPETWPFAPSPTSPGSSPSKAVWNTSTVPGADGGSQGPVL